MTTAGSIISQNIHLIDLFPQAVGGFDITKPPKDWQTPAGFNDSRFINPDFPGYYVFRKITLQGGVPTIVNFPISITDAEACNPLAGAKLLSGQKVLTPIPTPVDETKIPVGWTVGMNLTNNISLIPTQSPTPVATSGLTVDEHNAIMEILSYVRSH